jgi:4-hydroxy-tetrahydrodipicolinate synthase
MHAPASKLYHGVVVPMITPFTAAGELDEAAVCRLLDHFVTGGVVGVLLLGTTGEDASISLPTRRRLVATAARHARGRLTLYAGISDNCLAHCLEAAEAYHALGVDALVARLPTYYDLGAEDMLAFYQTLLAAISGPLVLYNIPSTTHMSLPLEVVERLSQHPQVVGIKDSENNWPRFADLLQRLGGRENFSIFCGTGAYFDQALVHGADGIVPTAGNLLPSLCQSLYALARSGDGTRLAACQQQLLSVARLYAGSRLGQTYGRLKAAMSLWGLCDAYVLPPLPTPSVEEQQAVRAAVQHWLSQQPEGVR